LHPVIYGVNCTPWKKIRVFHLSKERFLASFLYIISSESGRSLQYLRKNIFKDPIIKLRKIANFLTDSGFGLLKTLASKFSIAK